MQYLCTCWIASARARAKTVFGHLKDRFFTRPFKNSCNSTFLQNYFLAYSICANCVIFLTEVLWADKCVFCNSEIISLFRQILAIHWSFSPLFLGKLWNPRFLLFFDVALQKGPQQWCGISILTDKNFRNQPLALLRCEWCKQAVPPVSSPPSVSAILEKGLLLHQIHVWQRLGNDLRLRER